jgi:hypothetical protein
MSPANPSSVGSLLARVRRAVAGALAIVSVAACAGNGAFAWADPATGNGEPNPYPELRYFTKIDADPYVVPGQGVWFVTAQGLNCGIWFRGSFGCSGDIPGAPPNVHQIGWIAGDTRVHYDWTLSSRFPKTQGTQSIPPLNFIESEGTSCATTVDGSTYFERGPWRLYITPTRTWLNGPTYS